MILYFIFVEKGKKFGTIESSYPIRRIRDWNFWKSAEI